MKRFLIVVMCLSVLVGGSYYAVYYRGSYLAFLRNGQVEIPFRTQGRNWQRFVPEEDSGGYYEELIFRGVEITSFLPGSKPTEYRTGTQTYLRWFDQIADMGANAVHVPVIMDSDFYEALDQHNADSETPLYLLQGIGVSENALSADGNMYENGMYEEMLQTGRAAVDVIHGRRIIAFQKIGGTGHYRRDVSKWTIGYLLEPEWLPDLIAYTDHSAGRNGSYRGMFYETADGASVTEAMLAEVMDTMTAYEHDKYQRQRPIGFVAQPECDFLRYEEVYARQLHKYAWLDMEHIQPAASNRAGCFAAYRLYEYCQDYQKYLSAEQKPFAAQYLTQASGETPFSGYMKLLYGHHSMPLIASYSSSSARGCASAFHRPMTERQQGQDLAAISRQLEQDGWAGGFISSWQDVWIHRSFNTAFAQDEDTGYCWHDLQTEGQCSGLMAFDPGEEAVCVLDGKPGEWTGRQPVYADGNRKLYAAYDEEALYLLLEGVPASEPCYIGLDTCPEAGARHSETPELVFDREADFVVCVASSGARVLVNERYDATRAHFHYEMTGDDPFAPPPDQDTERFLPVRLALPTAKLIDDLNTENRILTRLRAYETGILREGNGDPESDAYDSLADFCRGEDCLELRLPWLMLNVGDPSAMAVHGDYYKRYGVEYLPVREIYMGCGNGAGEISLHKMEIQGLGKQVRFRERLKESYRIMQEVWKNNENSR